MTRLFYSAVCLAKNKINSPAEAPPRFALGEEEGTERYGGGTILVNRGQVQHKLTKRKL